MIEGSSYRTVDRVVTLRRRPAAAKAQAAEPAVAVEPDAEISLRLWAVAASGRWRVLLWNPEGRDPREPVPADQLAFRQGFEKLVPLRGSNFDGQTLTWVLRLQSEGPSQSYDVRMTLYQGGDPVPGGDFSYSGALDGSEEISGRFHFRQEAAPEPALGE